MSKPTLDPRSVKVAVELTNRCNLRCAMCPMGKLQRPQADMPWDLVQRVAAELALHKIKVDWLHEMGEPLLYPRLAEAIDLFPGCGVSTNAVTLDQEYGRELLATSLERIRLCLDTVNPRVYPHIRRGGIFEEVVGNIRTFLELSRGHSIRVEIQRLIALPTAHETVEDFERFLHLDRFPQATVIEKTCEGLDTTDSTQLHDAFFGCFQGGLFTWLVVLADGRVTHCCYDAHGLQAIGDLKHQSLEAILSSPVLKRFKAAFAKKDWQTLPRCGECYKNASATGAVVDRVLRIGHRLDRVLPVKEVARKIINR